MKEKVIKTVSYKNEYHSIIDPMHAVLTHMNLYNKSKEMLGGMSISAFRFNIEKDLSIDSNYLYNWINENWLAADFLGIYTEVYSGRVNSPTFPLEQEECIAKIKEWVNNDSPVIAWYNAFVVIIGYSEEKSEIYYLNGKDEEIQALRFENFGQSNYPFWYLQGFGEKLHIDDMSIYIESLIQAVYKWERHDDTLPKETFGCGEQGYNILINHIKSSCDLARMIPIIEFYMKNKQLIYMYMRQVSKYIPEITPITDKYEVLYDTYNEIYCLLTKVQRNKEHLLSKIYIAKETESQAIQMIKDIYKEIIDNRYMDIGLR